jgi:hypothetical protein
METFLAEAHEVPQNRCTASLQEYQTSVNKKDKTSPITVHNQG